MNYALILDAALAAIDLGIRLSSNPEDLERYIKLRTKVLNEQVRLANLSQTELEEEAEASDPNQLGFFSDLDNAASSDEHTE